MLQDIFNEKINSLKKNDLNILQIGGCDGIFNDPIYDLVCKNNYNLHVIEPVPKYYNELIQNYIHISNVKCYNCAISSFTGTTKLNYINNNNSKYEWLKGCSSLHKNKNVLSGFIGKQLNIKVEEELINFINSNTTEILVNCFSLLDFLNINNIQLIDVFITDTEGEDFNIFTQFNFKQHQPKIYYTEIYNWTKEEKGHAVTILTTLDYICITDGYNMLAYEEK